VSRIRGLDFGVDQSVVTRSRELLLRGGQLRLVALGNSVMNAIEARIRMVKKVDQSVSLTKSERWTEFYTYYFSLPNDELKLLMKEIILDGDDGEFDAARSAWRRQTGIGALGNHGREIDTESRDGWWSRERD